MKYILFLLSLSCLFSCSTIENEPGEDVKIDANLLNEFKFAEGTWWRTIDKEGIVDTIRVSSIRSITIAHETNSNLGRNEVSYENIVKVYASTNITRRRANTYQINNTAVTASGFHGFARYNFPVFTFNENFVYPYEGSSYKIKKEKDLHDYQFRGREFPLVYKSVAINEEMPQDSFVNLIEPMHGLIRQEHYQNGMLVYWKDYTESIIVHQF